VDDSGFPAGAWAVGNRWIFDVKRRSTRAVVDEAAALHYRSFWSIEASSLTPSGRRVTLVEEGGDLRGVKTTVFVESGCVRFDKAKDRSFCLSDGRTTQLSVLGSRYDGVVVSNGKREFSVAPDIGVVRIVGEGDRHETETTLELVGFQAGGREGGDTSLTPMTCDWYVSKRKPQKIRLIENSDPISGAVSRFLGAPTGRIDVDMTNRHGAAGATAVTDDNGSVLRIGGVTGPLGDGVRLRGKLRALKGFESLDGTTDYLMVTTMDDREMILHMLPIRDGQVSGDLHISAMVLDPKMDYSETFLTNDGPDACKLQVVVGDHRDKSYLAADYPFAGDSLRRAGGSLSIQTNSWRNTSSLQ